MNFPTDGCNSSFKHVSKSKQPSQPKNTAQPIESKIKKQEISEEKWIPKKKNWRTTASIEKRTNAMNEVLKDKAFIEEYRNQLVSYWKKNDSW